jgi:siroheme synthase-like protein
MCYPESLLNKFQKVPNNELSYSLTPKAENENRLYPVFLKLEDLRLLIVGGGNVALEKLQSALGNSPATKITLVAPLVNSEITDLAKEFNLIIHKRKFRAEDCDKADLVIVAVNDFKVSEQITQEAHRRNLLVNVADTPALCNFYLGSIVRKGDLKLAISTNGKSPTLAKRLREVLTEAIPDQIQLSIEKLNELRSHLNGPFKEKVNRLNSVTQLLISRKKSGKRIKSVL